MDSSVDKQYLVSISNVPSAPENPQFTPSLLIEERYLVILPGVRNLKTTIVVSAAMLVAAHALATLEVAPTRNPQAAEEQAQETVKLAISGMV